MPAETLNCPSCGAAIATDSTQCQYCKSLLQTVACPSCFGHMFLGGKFCPHCGAKADLARPEPATAHRCPRCTCSLEAVSVGGMPLEQCPRCGGLWVGAETFDRICSDRESQAAAIDLNPPAPAQPEQQVVYLKCPQCSQLMSRKNFAQRSGVIIDICRPHGIWFDRSELRRIIEFIRAGGLDRARRCEIEELDRQRQLLEIQRRIDSAQNTRWTDTDASGSASVDLVDGIAAVLRSVLRRR